MKAIPTHTFLLFQEIPDEATFNRLLENVRPLKSFPIGNGDKLRLIFAQESYDELSEKVFRGIDPKSKALLVRISDVAAAPSARLAA